MDNTVGECWIKKYRNSITGQDELRITRADPHVLIADSILRAAFCEVDHPEITIRKPSEGHGSTGHSVGRYGCRSPLGRICFYDSLVTITGTNIAVTYRIGDYDPTPDGWAATLQPRRTPGQLT
ncbi:hypothetical protein [Mycobacterium sp. NPDC004974]